jgi:hypothetical protein
MVDTASKFMPLRIQRICPAGRKRRFDSIYPDEQEFWLWRPTRYRQAAAGS